MRPCLAIALCLVGCNADGRGADAIGPVSGDVSVTTYVRHGALAPGTPIGGVAIDVVQADGTGVQIARTDPGGHVTLHDMRPGAIVSATYPADQFLLPVTTYVGVQPGDQLTFGDGYFPPESSTTPLSIQVSVAEYAGAHRYTAATSCGFGSTTSFVPVMTIPLAGCRTSAGPLMLFVIGQTDDLVGTVFLPSVSYAVPTTANAGPWVLDPRGNFAMSITGLDHALPLQLDATAAFGDQLLLTRSPFSGITTTATTATASLTMPVTAPRIVGHARVGVDPPPTDARFGFADVYRSIAGTATSVELSAPTVPFVVGGQYNAALQHAAWLQGDGGYDGATLTLDWRLSTSAPDFSSVHWLVVLPPGQTDLDLAIRPPVLADHLPSPIEAPTVAVHLFDYDDVSGYDALRALPEWQLAGNGVENGVLDAVGYGDRSGGQIATGSL